MSTKLKPQEKNQMSEIDENISKLFDIKKRLGKGAYGIVWKASDKRSNETVALKKIFDAFRDETDAQRTFREITFLKAFRIHPNIVKLENVYKASNNLDIYLIFEFMESDLHNIIKRGHVLKDIHKRYVMYQLINAVKYIHSGNVIHRDLKPSNILIDNKCRCKVADFGLARSVSQRPFNGEFSDDRIVEPQLTDYVATRWYRAPEILVASKKYTKGIDMWSLGCILGEMIRGKPLFQGTSTVNQIEKIVAALPDITDNDISAVGAGFGSVLLNKHISKEKHASLHELISNGAEDGINMVKSLLVLDPLKRLTAKEAICHSYVEKFRNSTPEVELNVDILPPFRDDIRLTVPEYRSKLYEIAQTTVDKVNILRQNAGCNKNGVTTLQKDQKITNSSEQIETVRRSSKTKINYSKDEKSSSKEKLLQRSEKHELEVCPILNGERKSVKKITMSPIPITKRKSSTILHKTPEQKLIQHLDNKVYHNTSKSKLHSKPNQTIEETALGNQDLDKRYSVDAGYSTQSSGYKQQLPNDYKQQQPNGYKQQQSNGYKQQQPNGYKQQRPPNGVRQNYDYSTKGHRNTSSLQKAENNPHGNHHRRAESESNEHLNRSNPAIALNNKAPYVRNTKSDIMTNSKSTQQQHIRVCYEKKLQELENEIVKYKKEVNMFCKDTYRFAYQNRIEGDTNKKAVETQFEPAQYNRDNTSTHASKAPNLPIMPMVGNSRKKSYFQMPPNCKSECDVETDDGIECDRMGIELIKAQKSKQYLNYNQHHFRPMSKLI